MSGMLSMLCVILILSVTTTTVRAGLKCDAVKPYFESQGFPATDIPKEAISCKFLFSFFTLKSIEFTFRTCYIVTRFELRIVCINGANCGKFEIYNVI